MVATVAIAAIPVVAALVVPLDERVAAGAREAAEGDAVREAAEAELAIRSNQVAAALAQRDADANRSSADLGGTMSEVKIGVRARSAVTPKPSVPADDSSAVRLAASAASVLRGDGFTTSMLATPRCQAGCEARIVVVDAELYLDTALVIGDVGVRVARVAFVAVDPVVRRRTSLVEGSAT